MTCASSSSPVHTVTDWSIRLGVHAAAHLPESVDGTPRAEVLGWLSAFLGRWTADIAGTAAAAGS